ncbi:MAG: hypothetical protein K0S65_3954 [Labilithrix sp.]|nr:hypothetical protein [Labilithrix sp.]
MTRASIRNRLRYVYLGAVPAAAFVLSLFACGDEESVRRFDATTPDAARESSASLPETGAALDAGTDVDARMPFDGSDEVVVCTATPCVTRLVGNGGHFCALLADKSVRCWGSGYNAFGTFDGGPHPDVSTPKDMGLSDVAELTSGNGTTCARFTDGTIACWGGNQGNELGLDPPSSDYQAHDIAKVARDGAALTGFTSVELGYSGVTFAAKDGVLWSWGDNSSLALARSNEEGQYLAPGPATDLAGLDVVRAGGFSNPNYLGIGYAITKDGRLFTWGNSVQMVAYPGIVPVAVEGLENVGSVSVTAANICAVADGVLYCWGADGKLACSRTKDAILTPLEIRTHGEGRAQQVALNYSTTCVRKADGTVECCGSDGWGQLATGVANTTPPNAGDPPFPLLVEAKGFTGHVVQIAVGARNMCALMQGGTVQCAGANDQGALGQGTVDNERHPVPLVVKF